MIRIRNRLSITLSATLIAALCAACASKKEDAPPIVQPDQGLPTESSDLVYAEGWKEIVIEANSAKTVVDLMGHYTTDRNVCQRRGDGAYEVAGWNKLSELMNQAAKSTPLTAPRCTPSAMESKLYNPGTVVVQLSEGAEKRQIFEFKNGDICTTVSDVALANSLLEQVEETIKLADQADAMDCPGYRPPSL